MKNRTIIISGVVILAFGYGLGYYASPTKVKIKKEVKIVTKKVQDKTVKKNVVKTTTKNPDGSIITTEVDKSIVEVDTQVNVNKDENTKIVKTKEHPKWHIAGQLNLKPLDKSQTISPGVSIDRRIIGPIWAGIYFGRDNGITVGARLSWSF